MDLSTVGYVIQDFDSTTGEIVVKFDSAPPFPIILPVINGLYPEGEQLDTFIRTFIPVSFYERLEQTESASNAEAINALVVPPSPVE